ncbi:MAG: DMT family transporter [bacterium]|nr:DMT family transporter [bacterium]
MHRKTAIGLLGVLGIWFTAGLALPFVNVLKMFTPQQLMVFRGFLTALMAFIGLKGIIGRVDKYTYLIALTLPFATLGLFQGIRHWGAGPTIIIITATPLINLIIAAFLGRRISSAAVIGLALMLGGVIMARWGGHFQWTGFLWTAFGTIMNGILYEWFARAKANPLQKCFWACIGMGVLGLLLSINASWSRIAEPKLIMAVVGFAFVGGFLYWLSNLIAFEKLPTLEASILAQGETPAVIIGAHFMLKESLALTQWFGVAIALFGAWYLSRWLTKKNTQKQTTG